MNRYSLYHGFTLIELIVAISIIAIIGGISVSTFYTARPSKERGTIADGIAAVLEQAKADAIAGKNGENYGVYFASTSYVYFGGNSYNSSDSNNKNYQIPSGWQLNETIPGGSSVIFIRITGLPQAIGTITASLTSGGASSTSVSVGSGGDINVIK
jgi:prepilin-type N-terminal cleavage/methylation domain-containing protein